ncbi:hypothetical protein PaecuDRAFT_3097 [Paenibacillus curdlanolyticus YK9]|uniref:Uncharacterized protein n=1 Tax=Paenibacillus curdlanolyticus YK9 TaxID=717606 RepID=E0IBQ8_9BACL|nr:hypothetical protein PaecuDRAFT_3097 [Paenibacillus curdlanolyticus YK9]
MSITGWVWMQLTLQERIGIMEFASDQNALKWKTARSG